MTSALLKHETEEERSARVARAPRRVIACGACAHTLTTADARVEHGGQHRHLCVNPAGVCYEIGCFARAPGTVAHGPRESYWSWFQGHLWQIALCGACRAHVGWSFHPGDGSSAAFYGLILDRVVERDEDAPET